MRQRAAIFAGLLALTGCSDDISNDPEVLWILDTFSSARAGQSGMWHVLSIANYSFREGGTGVRTSVSWCGETVSELENECDSCLTVWCGAAPELCER